MNRLALALVFVPAALGQTQQSVILSLSPSSAVAGQGSFTLTVDGSNFCSPAPAQGGGSTVIFNDTRLQTTFVSTSRLTALVTASLVANPGIVNVSVLNQSCSFGSSAPVRFEITTAAPLAITTASPLAGGVVGRPYTVVFAAAGGQSPYTFAGTPPAGLTLASNGTLSGTPTSAGTFNFSVTVTDAAGKTATRSFDLTVNPALSIATTTLPQGTVGAAYSATITASGGRPPYTFTADTLPSGFTLSSSGTLTGTPASAGSFSITVTVADNAEGRVSRTFTLTIVSGLSITTTSLPAATVGTTYSATVQASGGRAPYTFSGVLGAGLSMSGSGVISGNPARPGPFQFTVTVTDAAGATASKDFSIDMRLPATPSVSIGGVTDTPSPASQPNVTVSVGGAFPVDIDGQVQLSFAPDVTGGVTASSDDPAIQFSSGGRTASFRIPAGSTQAQFTGGQPAIQTGTVAGTITLSVTLRAVETNITPGTPPSRTIRVGRAAPSISSVRVVRNANGFDVITTGFATTREMTQAVFHFTAAAGANLQTTDITVSVGSAFTTWYQDSSSTQFGSQFSYTQPFTVQGNANAFTSVSVTLTNGIGSSQAASAQAP